MDAAEYLEQAGQVLELRETLREILADPAFAWVHEVKTPAGKSVACVITELLDRQPAAAESELYRLLTRLIAYRLRYMVGGGA